MHDNFSTLDFLIFRTHVRKRLRGYGVRSYQISVVSCQSAEGGMERVAVGAAGRQSGAKAAVDAAVDGSLRSLKSLRSLTTTEN